MTNAYKIYWTSSPANAITSSSWRTPSQVANASSRSAPGLASSFSPRNLWAVNNDGTGSTRMWSTIYDFDNFKWSNEDEIPQNYTNSRPDLTMFDSKIWCAYRGTDNNIYYITSVDGKNWSNPKSIPSAKGAFTGPSLAVKGDTLYCVYAANGYQSDGNMHCTYTNDGVNWIVPPKMDWNATSSAPALAVFGKNLWCMYRDYNSNGLCVAISSNGYSWTTPSAPISGQSTDAEPAMVWLPDEHWMLCIYGDSLGGPNLWYTVNKSGDPQEWGAGQPINGVSRAPGTGVALATATDLTTHDDIVYCAYLNAS